ncbi:MAG: dihydrodipicolinate synthase family protein [Pirellulales bacterium]
MDTRPVTTETLAGSVIAVPPLCRTPDLDIDDAANARLIQYLEAGGVTTLLYGGNAVLGHVALSEYADLLSALRDSAAANTLVIPSVGPGFGMMMDQAEVLRDMEFPTAMLLPLKEGTTPTGIANGFRRFVERFGRPGVLYIKHDGAVDVSTVRRMVSDGLISWIKYAVVRPNAANDPFLREMIDAIGTDLIVSGMGEQPALTHLRDFGLPGFTSGCVCVAPKLSMDMLRAAKAGDYTTAEAIRRQFAPLETLRDAINPVRVLHAAVRLADIVDTGPITPLLSEVSGEDELRIGDAAKQLLSLATAAV